jgi:class 3 adenylate cyclase
MAAGLALGAVATVDRYRWIGQTEPGFSVMENLLVGVGGAERGDLEPLDLVRAVDGQLVLSGRDVQAAVRRHPAGTPHRYLVYRRGQLVEVVVPSRVATLREFQAYLVEGVLAGALLIVLGALVFLARPGGAQSWLFLSFALLSSVVSLAYADAHTTYRFSSVFLTAWALLPAVFIHLGLIFPQRRSLLRRFPRLAVAPYLLSAGVAALLQLRFDPEYETRLRLVAGVGAAYWGLALLVLVLTLARTSLAGTTAVMRQRARAMMVAFAIGYLPPVLGTAVEAVFQVGVPYLRALWKLNFVFPAVMAYAMARYNLFQFRTVVRAGTVYSVVTGLVVLVYAGAIALVDLVFSTLALSRSPLVPATVVALAVVVFLNPVYARTQALVDRLFFRERLDLQQALERVSDLMVSLLDLDRIGALIASTAEELFHPETQVLLLDDPAAAGYGVLAPRAPAGPAAVPLFVPRDSGLVRALGRVRAPMGRERLEEDPGLADLREACLADLAALRAEVVVPVLFRDRVTGLLALGPKRSGDAYAAEDLRTLRLLANQSAVALEHAKAYAALERSNAELTDALRRVQILESIRASLAKFVPRTVQTLIEAAPEAPLLDKREADVSVLFVDIVGYTRLSERLDLAGVDRLVERYFASFLDEILRRGGDVNETAGDGLMAIFQDPDPRRHARAAVETGLGVLRRTREINEREAAEAPILVHLGVNSGPATVGATKIEGAAATRWTYTASGPVTNLAARLAAVADGGEVLVGPETRRRLGGEFPFEPAGERRLHNIDRPLPVFRLRAGSGLDSSTSRPAARA